MLLKNEQELKYSAIFSALKKDKKAQQSVTRLGKTEDWVILRQFISELKQTLLEATLEVDSIDDIRRYKFLIKGMESIVILPQLVNDIKKVEKKDKIGKEQEEEQANRRKYAPGNFVRETVRKLRT